MGEEATGRSTRKTAYDFKLGGSREFCLESIGSYCTVPFQEAVLVLVGQRP